MLQLTLIRHAKSSWDDPSVKDYDRPLNARGFRDAPLMGKILKEKLAPIEQLISSPALRALTTCKLISEKLGYPEDRIKQEPQLYDASLHKLKKIIHAFDNATKHYGLVAHNPGMSLLSDHLDRGQTGDLPTCAVASFTFELDDWQAVGRNSGKLVLFEFPKKYK